MLTLMSSTAAGIGTAVAIIFVAIFLLIIFAIVIPIPLWLAAVFSEVKINITSLIGMRLRRVPPAVILNAMIQSKKAGITIDSDQLEQHFLSGGNVFRIVRALIAADKAGITLTFKQATAIDLAGRNVLEAVQMSVLPKIIETPLIAAVAKDGIQVKALAKITVRTNLDRLVGGAGAETILARVGEGIVTTIGSATTHKAVLENPDMISNTILSKGLDAGTAYEILSIDIADVDVGANIGAKLQIDQANADKNIAQAKAEERRAMAVATEQEMKAKISEMKAKLVDTKAQVPLAISDSLYSGKLGIMEYYKLKNIMADTKMRDSISQSDGKQNALA
jgi:uncharacterized protein YqfA (UPF0365 family)